MTDLKRAIADVTDAEWNAVDALAGIESRGFILGAALALQRRKGFVLVRKQGKLPPPVVDVAYDLEYGSGVLEMQRGRRAVPACRLLGRGAGGADRSEFGEGLSMATSAPARRHSLLIG